MPVASLSSAKISFLDEGDGEPILLVHGFASTKEVNWLNTGWVRTLCDAGYRVVALDNRGHGASSKFYEPADYQLANMVTDAAELLDHLGIERAHAMGYSMGAHICCALALKAGTRLMKAVFAGRGTAMIEDSRRWEAVRNALLAPSLADVSDATGRAFRQFADQTGGDLAALAACIAQREPFTPAELATIENPVLVAIGTDDEVAGSGDRLAEMIPAASHLPIPGRDHMRAVGDKVYKAGVVEFLARPA